MSRSLRDLASELSSLSDEELVALFQATLSNRPNAEAEPWIRSRRYFIGLAYQLDESDDGSPPQWSNWKISAIAKPDPAEYQNDTGDLFVGADWGFCQEAECTCGYYVCSNMKQGICQICHKNIGMT
jgi:hypothetical protein